MIAAWKLAAVHLANKLTAAQWATYGNVARIVALGVVGTSPVFATLLAAVRSPEGYRIATKRQTEVGRSVVPHHEPMCATPEDGESTRKSRCVHGGSGGRTISMLKGRCCGLVVVACCASACGGGDDPPASSQSSASTGAPDGSDAAILPAVYAGTSTEQGPGLPYDFTGTVKDSLPLTAAENAATTEANAKAKLRDPPGKSPIDRGFGVATVKAGGHP